MRRGMWLVVLFVLVGWGTAQPAGDMLYCVSFGGRRDLATVVRAGAVIRHVGRSEALVSGSAELGSRLRSGGWVCETVCAAGRPDELYLCYPASKDQSALERWGDVLWSERDGALLLGAAAQDIERIRGDCFMVYPLRESVDADSWFDNKPAPLVGSRSEETERAVRGMVEDVIESVSSDSLMLCIERLTQYSPDSLRSRFTFRDECLTEAKPYIEKKLRSYLPPGSTVDTLRFEKLGFRCDEPDSTRLYYGDNVTGVLEGTRRLGGYYIVCGHYDATAVRSFPDSALWWCENPAPGADDNASGVATVLEVARVLSELSDPTPVFPFDIRFVLFSAEELGLVGSTAYAQHVAALGDTIYGVINVDMTGLKRQEANPDTVHIVTNPGTRWLADWLVGTAVDYDIPIDAIRIDNPLAYSDHGSFWDEGYDALIAIEHWDPRERNPNYHTLDDVIGTITASQVEAVTEMVAGAVARFADPGTQFNLAVYGGDLSLSPSSLTTVTSAVGRMKVHVYGPAQPAEMTLEIWDGEPDQGRELSELLVDRTMGNGEVIYHEFDWELGESDLGEHDIWARILIEDPDEPADDNLACTTVRVTSPRLYVNGHYPWPNPASDVADLHFEYELSKEAGVILEVFDILGQKLAEFSRAHDPVASYEENNGTRAGWSSIRWGRTRGAARDLTSGFYIYRLSVYESGSAEPTDEVNGRFAVVR